MPVTVPLVVPCSFTVAPMIGSPASSTTLPTALIRLFLVLSPDCIFFTIIRLF